ncbi:DUF2190 family protein [Rhodococcoides fascians A25f]|uniref:capsid cement protein n=1 Tax=Rhodococcoides fascians TaxID=1828 RepID=UPI0005609AF2|nr:capsid cement protein [Rhodococcus fascians]QII05903.1 DUF2190 family protein [Rhodococcus fascians A25f]
MNVSVYQPGADVTVRATSAVLAKRLVAVSGNRVGGNIAVAPAPAAARAFGVAKEDAGSGELVAVSRGASRVVLIRAAGTIAANAEVEVGAAGQVVTKTSGIAVGFAVTGAASGADAEISLY